MAYPFPPGYSDFVFKFGRISGPAADVETMVWAGGGAYNGILANEAPISIVSTSDLDKVGGGGATSVVIVYQGEDGLEKFYIAQLNGLTPVDLPISADVSYNAWVLDSEGNGSADLTGANIGVISCYETGTATNILWRIAAGEGRALLCFYRVPSNKYLELTGIDAFPIGAKPIINRLRTKSNKEQPWVVQAIADSLTSPIPVNIPELPQVARPGSYLCITAQVEQSSTDVSAYFSGTLQDYEGDKNINFPF